MYPDLEKENVPATNSSSFTNVTPEKGNIDIFGVNVSLYLLGLGLLHRFSKSLWILIYLSVAKNPLRRKYMICFLASRDKYVRGANVIALASVA